MQHLSRHCIQLHWDEVLWADSFGQADCSVLWDKGHKPSKSMWNACNGLGCSGLRLQEACVPSLVPEGAHLCVQFSLTSDPVPLLSVLGACRYQCFKSAWMFEVFHRGFSFPFTYKNLKTALQVYDKEVQWTLGAILYRTRFLPLRYGCEFGNKHQTQDAFLQLRCTMATATGALQVAPLQAEPQSCALWLCCPLPPSQRCCTRQLFSSAVLPTLDRTFTPGFVGVKAFVALQPFSTNCL